MSRPEFVIVGAGLAGAKAAQALREQGFDGGLTLIGSESERPYERPPLSKELLRGESEREAAFVHPDGFYEQHEIELVTGTTVTGIDPGRSRITFDDGRELAYDRLLLSPGAEPRRLTTPGAELDGIHYLRTMADCDRLRERLDSGGHVAVVGAGWIGSEFAASARQRDLAVTLIDPLALPNERIFGPEIGTFYRNLHAQHGVDMVLGEGVEMIARDGARLRLRTTRAHVIDCDFVVVGVGVSPRVELAAAAGLGVENGIVVDEHLQTTAPGVFAAGDVAAAWHPFYGRRIRVEHWANALHQGPAAAAGMLGEPVSYDRVPYFFSDQYDVGMEYSGYAPSWDEVVFRGDPDSGRFIAFWVHEGRVLAGMNVNVWDVNEHIQTLIRSREPVEPEALRDLAVPLESLAGNTTS